MHDHDQPFPFLNNNNILPFLSLSLARYALLPFFFFPLSSCVRVCFGKKGKEYTTFSLIIFSSLLLDFILVDFCSNLFSF